MDIMANKKNGFIGAFATQQCRWRHYVFRMSRCPVCLVRYLMNGLNILGKTDGEY